MRLVRSALLVLALLLAGAPAALAARPATLTGTLTGARLPRAGRGVVPVRAVRLADGRVVAGDYANARGRFSLKAPGGAYALLASVITPRGSRPLQRVVAFARARGGRRVGVRATLRRSRRRPRARRAATFGFVQVDVPALWVQQWSTPRGDLAIMRKGMADMMITDLIPEIGSCDGIIVERTRLQDVLRELSLQQLPGFDPSTRLRTDRLIAHNGTVTGTLSASGGDITLTATYTDLRSGRRGTVAVSGPGEDLFELAPQLARKLGRVICQETPRTYAGSFSGTATTTLSRLVLRWSGTATFELTRDRRAAPDGWPAGTYLHYALREASAHVTLEGTRIGGGVCTVQGATDITLPAGAPGGEALVQAGGDGEPAFHLIVPTPATAEVPYTESGFGCNQVDPRYPLTAIPFAFTPSPVNTQNGALQASASWNRDVFTHLTFNFAFAPRG